MIQISIAKQKLFIFQKNALMRSYPISTSKYGIGNKVGSNKTPLGKHQIIGKYGRNARIGEIFKRRKRIGIMARSLHGHTDLITTRILRLDGLEKGLNKGKGIDSFHRCIYIHGTPEENRIGKPSSHGCIRMKNKDVAELFRMVKRGDSVIIMR